MNTPTPRTDETRRIDNGETGPLLDEMEMLERELTALTAEVERLKASISNQSSLTWWVKDELVACAKRADKAEAECLEQAKLLGRSGEREADLLGKLKRMENKK